MSEKNEIVDDCVDTLCYALDEIEAIDNSLHSAALNVLSAYHAAPDDNRSEFEETLMSLGETVDAVVCLKGAAESLYRRIDALKAKRAKAKKGGK